MSKQVHEYSTVEEENARLREQVELLNQYIESDGRGSAVGVAIAMAALGGAVCSSATLIATWWWLWR